MDNNIKLESKFVSEISGNFVVPSYQRGYRWGKIEVERLLNDINDNCENNYYCLQPVVVKKNDKGEYELIDGQQRLTTIYLIYKYLHSKFNFPEPNFSINYAIRKDSSEFLKNIDASQCETYIDFWFIYHAYKTIENWISGNIANGALDLPKYFNKKVKIIWYEAGENENAVSLFTRLNIGKIPLTNAELVKAMFLSNAKENNTGDIRPQEIAFQWDYIETELHNNSFWYFLTNPKPNPSDEYQTRIELILDLIAGKTSNSYDKYATFFKFDERREKGEKLSDIWNEIYKTFMLLKEWYENRSYYHLIGFLISSGSKSLYDIYRASKGKTKTEFEKTLIEYIKNAVKLNDGENYGDTSYDNKSDYEKIRKLLFLFNVESVRTIKNQYQRFPFDKYKIDENGKKTIWSLEHIHAQHSEGLSKDNYKDWLKKHLESVSTISVVLTDPKKIDDCKKLIDKMKPAIEKAENKTLSQNEFEEIRKEVVEVLSEKGSSQYMHSISNLALLAGSDNSSLSNSTFDVKRNDIIKMEGEGSFIPLCTKRVFLKYYTDSKDNQVHFWGEADRKAYICAINKILKCYDVKIDI